MREESKSVIGDYVDPTVLNAARLHAEGVALRQERKRRNRASRQATKPPVDPMYAGINCVSGQPPRGVSRQDEAIARVRHARAQVRHTELELSRLMETTSSKPSYAPSDVQAGGRAVRAEWERSVNPNRSTTKKTPNRCRKPKVAAANGTRTKGVHL